MRIEDSFVVAAPVERVWRFITDPDQVAPCVPGCQNVEALGPDSYKADVKVSLGPIRTTFSVVVELTEQEAPTFLASLTKGEEGGKASTLTASNELRLVALDAERTEVRYSSEVSIFGRFGKYGMGMMKKRAEKIGGEFAQAFAARVEGADAPADAASDAGGA